MAVALMSMQDGKNEQFAVSPSGEILNTRSFSLCVHVVFQLDEPVDVSHAKKAIHEILLSKNPRFSCIVTKDSKGVLRWEKTEVNVEEHVFVAEFPANLTSYDQHVEEYVSDMHLRPLPPSRPLWEFHFLNYKTTNAEATVILNLHHMLGDGVSLMSLALACSTTVNTPTCLRLPPTITSISQQESSLIHDYKRQIHATRFRSPFGLFWEFMYRQWCHFLIMWYTLDDLIGSFLRVKWIEDSRFPIRGPPGVELLPKVMASTTFTLHDIRQIKNHVGGSVNDVIMGVVFYGFRRYCQRVLPDTNEMENLRVTALALMNTRSQPGIKGLEEMSKSKTGAPWGNRFGYLHLRVPMEKLEDPLEYVRRAKHMTEKKKMSLGVFLTGRLINFITLFKGPKASAKALYNTLANTTLTVTNMQGPTEEIALAGYSIKSSFFSVSGVPQSILVTCLSYKESVRVQVIAAKGYVDANKLSECFKEAFMEMKDVL